MPTPPKTPEINPQLDGEPSLETRTNGAGEELLSTLSAVLDSIPNTPRGPQSLAERLGIDKVLASRLLKALRGTDPMSVVHRMPGPDPLRRVLKAAARHSSSKSVLVPARKAIDRFELLIRDEVGSRSSLDAILSVWVPEARREFELRRKQSAFRAMSQLKGAEAQTLLATTFLHPAADGEHVDVVWLSGLVGLQRLRPGAVVRLTTRRVEETEGKGERRPRTIDGEDLGGDHSNVLDEFCSSPLPRLSVERVGEVVSYTLADERFGPAGQVDLVFAEANMAEIKRYRKGFFFAEVSTPAKRLHFDVFVHEDLDTGNLPELRIYDTSFEGIANVNDPTRDLDRLDMLETVDSLGTGIGRFRSTSVPRYAELVHFICDRMAWDGTRFRGYRCQIDYPIYGSQVSLIFD